MVFGIAFDADGGAPIIQRCLAVFVAKLYDHGQNLDAEQQERDGEVKEAEGVVAFVPAAEDDLIHGGEAAKDVVVLHAFDAAAGGVPLGEDLFGLGIMGAAFFDGFGGGRAGAGELLGGSTQLGHEGEFALLQGLHLILHDAGPARAESGAASSFASAFFVSLLAPVLEVLTRAGEGFLRGGYECGGLDFRGVKTVDLAAQGLADCGELRGVLGFQAFEGLAAVSFDFLIDHAVRKPNDRWVSKDDGTDDGDADAEQSAKAEPLR